VDPAVQIDQSILQAGLILLPGDAIYAGGGLSLKREEAFPEQSDRQMVEQGGELRLLPFSRATLRTPANPWDTRASLCVECVLD